MNELLRLWKIEYLIGKTSVSLSVSTSNRLDVWAGNWSEPCLDLTQPLDSSQALSAITWAVMKAAGREPTAEELAMMSADIARFFEQAKGANK